MKPVTHPTMASRTSTRDQGFSARPRARSSGWCTAKPGSRNRMRPKPTAAAAARCASSFSRECPCVQAVVQHNEPLHSEHGVGAEPWRVRAGVYVNPYTGLAPLDPVDRQRPATQVWVLIGGWLAPPRNGFLPKGAEMDSNVQCDTEGAESVFRLLGHRTLVTLAATLEAHLRQRDMHRLRGHAARGE